MLERAQRLLLRLEQESPQYIRFAVERAIRLEQKSPVPHILRILRMPQYIYLVFVEEESDMSTSPSATFISKLHEFLHMITCHIGWSLQIRRNLLPVFSSFSGGSLRL